MAKKKRDTAAAAAATPTADVVPETTAAAPEIKPPPLPEKPSVPTVPAVVEEMGNFTGERMKKAREQKGITLKEISEKTKISVATLSALEDERYEDMPSARVYVRGFVRCLAEEVGLDKEEVSQSYVPRWERWFNENSRRY